MSVAPTVSQEFDFVLTEDETLWARMLADTSWGRVAMMLAVLSLASAAFFLKRRALRWVALSVTLVVLGFVDGGFLSVSHITSGIWAGPGVYLRDLPLLLIVVYTVVTTLVWGRVFCGFLCPFGALQDVIDRVVPRRFKRPLPQGLPSLLPGRHFGGAHGVDGPVPAHLAQRSRRHLRGGLQEVAQQSGQAGRADRARSFQEISARYAHDLSLARKPARRENC